MIVLKVDDVLKAAKAAREAGTLAAFHPEFQKLGREQYNCTYRYEGLPGVACGVGAGITDEQFQELPLSDNDEMIGDLIGKGKITVEGDDNILRRLQQKHDAILNHRSNGEGAQALEAEGNFDRYLDAQLAQIAA